MFGKKDYESLSVHLLLKFKKGHRSPIKADDYAPILAAHTASSRSERETWNGRKRMICSSDLAVDRK